MQLYLVDGARLREFRERAGIPQEELSLMVGAGKTWAAEMELESRVHVLEIIVQKLIRALGVEISDLSTFPDPPAPPSAPIDQTLNATRLREMREKAALSQEDLDEMAELEPGSVERVESVGPDEEIQASVDVIWKIAQALKVSPTLLIRR
jgi:transcriptional regulator with XRE-family HTH domain